MALRRALLVARGRNDSQADDTPSIQRAGRLKGGKAYLRWYICLLTATGASASPIHRLQKPLLGEARQSTDGLWLRCNQEQLAKFTQNK